MFDKFGQKYKDDVQRKLSDKVVQPNILGYSTNVWQVWSEL